LQQKDAERENFTMNDENRTLDEIDPALDPTLDHLSRRTLLGRVGGAAAVTALGAEAQAQRTGRASVLSNLEVEKKDITFPSTTTDGETATIKGFLAVPIPPPNVRWKPRGAVIVVHEIFGLNPHIRDLAVRLAQSGFIALAPNLFTREGDPPKLEGSNFAPVMQFVGKISDAQLMTDLKSGIKYLQKRKDANRNVGMMGFCWGGRVAMLSAANVQELKAAVAFYGRIRADKPTDNQPQSPLDLAAKMTVPLMGHFGEKDGGIPVADVDKLRETLKERNHPAEIFVYPNAGHAFNNNTRESYHAESAKKAWDRTLEWFEKHLY
jgi:carboxymethylenebutenolidase